MTHSENSPKAQEVKAVKAWAILNVDGTLNGNAIQALSQAKDEVERKGGRMIQVEIRPVTNENQPPLAEKSLLNPNPFSCQSDGNREKEALEWLAKNSYSLENDYDAYQVWDNGKDLCLSREKTPLEAIQSAMKSQDERKGV